MNPFRILLGIWLLLPVDAALVAQGTWSLAPLPVSQNINAISFIDSLRGWVAGDEGVMLQTTSGGEEWVIQSTGTSHRIRALSFTDSLHGWAAAQNYTTPPYGTILLKTTNGGTTWTSWLYPDEDIFINCIHYLDTLTGWMGGSPHALVSTVDGGLTWSQAAIDTSTLAFFPVLNISFLDAQTGFASGGIFDIAGVIWRTHNGGNSWQAIDPSQAPADEVHGLHIFDAQHVIGSGGDPDYGYGVGMIRTSDGGVNWSYTDIGIQGIAFDIAFRNSTEAWSPLGPTGQLIYSTDGALTWTAIPAPGESAIFRILFPDSLHGYAIGNNGAFLRYNPPIHPGIQPPETALPGAVSWQLFPNPVTASGSIITCNLQTASQTTVSVRLFDLHHREHPGIREHLLQAGNHTLSWHPGALMPGIYTALLVVDNLPVEVKPIVIIP